LPRERAVGPCPVCDRGKLRLRTIAHVEDDIDYGRFEAEVCDQCDERFFTEESARRIEAREQELGIWGLERRATVSYSGNSLIVRIPKDLERYLALKRGSEILVRPKGRKRIEIDVLS